MKEEWMVIDGYPNYAVSNLGRVVNIKRDRELLPRPNDEGHLRVSLSDEGRVRDFYVRRLVAAAFFEDYDPRQQVFHWNDDKEDNTVDNLRLRKREPLSAGSFLSSRKRQTGRQVVVVETGHVYRTARDCARHVGGDYGSVYACLRGDRRSHMGYTYQYYDEWSGEEAA